MKPKFISAEPRCTNAELKVDIADLPQRMTLKTLDHLPREMCARPLLPIYGEDRVTVVASYCQHCDGPMHRHQRGPEAKAAYYEARRNNLGLT